jgi:protein-tyrosine-phosphatase
VPRTGEEPAVLFACTMNAVRSPMAAAILSHLLGQSYRVASAGVRAGVSDPYAVAVMDEMGIDISEHEPRALTEIGDEMFDLIVTLSPESHHHGVELTRTMAAEVEYWPTLDATVLGGEGELESILERYRAVRDELFTRIKARFGTGGGPNV